MKDERVKPCPFCGGEAEIIKAHFFGGDIYFVECQHCLARGSGERLKYEAIAAWNRRNYPEKQDSSKLTYTDVEKMVKPLEWKYVEKRELLDVYKDWKSDLFFNFYQFDIRLSSDNFKALYLHDGHGHTIPLDAGREDVEYYKHSARKFLVDLVAAALGVERSGK